MTLNCLSPYSFNTMFPEFLKLFSYQDKETFAKTTELIKDYWSYKTPSGYIKWSHLFLNTQAAIEVTADLIDNAIKTGSFKSPDKVKDSALLVGEAFRHLTPPVCIHENIIPALLQTDVKPMDPPEYALPFFIFLLPKNFKTLCGLPDDKNYDLNFEAVFVGQIPPNSLGVTYVSKTTAFYGVYEWSDPFNKVDDNAKEEDFILERFIKNLVLTFSYEPKYYTEESIKEATKGKGFSSKSTPKSFQVRWLGKDYTQARERILYKSNKESTEDSRAVRPHWRRGHWHTVCCGAKRKQRKQQWFKPVFVNAG
jgi:hypothetical protein